MAVHERLVAALRQVEWEWIVVDDHSGDDTFAVIERLVALDPRVRGFRLGQNRGSHVAITCGLRYATGDAAALIVSDLQDPPELLPQMLERWHGGAQIVWATRRKQPGSWDHAWFATLYYWVMRRLVGIPDMPSTGTDFFLIDRVVIDAFNAAADRHVSVFALLMWLGFRREFIEYDKQERKFGKSGWTLRKKIKLVVDSAVGFSEFPMWWCMYAGCGLVAGAVVPLVIGIASYPGGAAAWLLAALGMWLTGVQLVALGVVGQYVWRALDEARGRPIYTVEAVVGRASAAATLAGSGRHGL